MAVLPITFEPSRHKSGKGKRIASTPPRITGFDFLMLNKRWKHEDLNTDFVRYSSATVRIYVWVFVIKSRFLPQLVDLQEPCGITPLLGSGAVSERCRYLRRGINKQSPQLRFYIRASTVTNSSPPPWHSIGVKPGVRECFGLWFI